MSNKTSNDYKLFIEKLNKWKDVQNPYPAKFEKNIMVHEIKNYDDGICNLKTAGRLIGIRVLGKIAFAHLQDDSGSSQISFSVDSVGKDKFKFLSKTLDVGDHIGVEGEVFTTQKGEKTLKCLKITLLAKAFRYLPEKWNGLQDPEIKSRQRYLDLISSPETRKRFSIRAKSLSYIRSFLNKNNFLEVETPILQSISSGASARPFITHHNSLNQDLYLRIAPETYLKRLIVAGYDRVFELGKCFRNEGMDSSHLQEFTMLEFYVAYWDFRDNIKFTKNLIQGLLEEVVQSQKIKYGDKLIDFSGNWEEITFNELVEKYTNIDLLKHNTIETLKNEIRKANLKLDLDQYVGLGSLMDALYKKYCRPHLIQPTVVTMQPQELVPLARKSDNDPRVLDMFQVVVNSWEIIKSYSELVDPQEQLKRFEEQAKLSEAGDEEAVMMEQDFIDAMEYGMPPNSGVGIGIDRLVALFTNSASIRDVIYFPNVKKINS